MNVVNLSELDPAWNWLSGRTDPARALRWAHASALSVAVPRGLPRAMTLRRAVAAWRAIGLLGPAEADPLLVSHGPRMTMYGALAARLRRREPGHLAYSFNFTELPQGRLRTLMRRAFRSVDRFVCFSQMERQLYARHFDLDPARIDMIHWAARPPRLDAATPLVAGDYACALGSQGRDYPTLIAAMRTLPSIRLVIVADAESLADTRIPANVEVRRRIPLVQAMNVLQHSRFSIVPLRGAEVPCGHVTLVSAMHCAKATIVSASSGVSDYVEDGVTGLTVPVGDAAAMAGAIERLWQDPAAARSLGDAARNFAAAHCGEDAVVAYFEHYLRTRARPQAAARSTDDSKIGDMR